MFCHASVYQCIVQRGVGSQFANYTVIRDSRTTPVHVEDPVSGAVPVVVQILPSQTLADFLYPVPHLDTVVAPDFHVTGKHSSIVYKAGGGGTLPELKIMSQNGQPPPSARLFHQKPVFAIRNRFWDTFTPKMINSLSANKKYRQKGLF